MSRIPRAGSDISTHAPLAGCDLRLHETMPDATDFNPRTPCGVRLAPPDFGGCQSINFNPRTPCGVRLKANLHKTHQGQFQPTHPLRGATFVNRRSETALLFQPTHPLRGATPSRAGSPRPANISTHAPLAGCDAMSAVYKLAQSKFQPTHPLRGATQGGRCEDHHDGISTHAPLAGCDGQECVNKMLECVISTHAPLAGCDGEGAYKIEPLKYFNPRTPCGVRRTNPNVYVPLLQFQPTHPLRGAT